MSAFVFNENKICQNPEEIIMWQAGKDKAVVRLAQAPTGQWCYGYTYDCYTGGASSGAGYGEYRKTYPTRHDALMAAITQALEWSDHYTQWPDGHKEAHRRFSNGVRKYRDEHTQLTLFDLLT